jgi:hypothetical protein
MEEYRLERIGTLVLAATVFFVSQVYAGGVPGKCVANCGDDKPRRQSNSESSYIPSGPSIQELEQQRRISEGHRLNNLGIEAYNKKNWPLAIEYFKQALQNNPNSKKIRENLSITEGLLQQEILERKRQQDQERRALEEKQEQERRERERQQKETQAANHMRENLARLSTRLDNASSNPQRGLDFDGRTGPSPATAPSSGLDFMGSQPVPVAGSGSPGTSPATTPLVDGSVVDLRDKQRPLVVDPAQLKGPESSSGLKIKEPPSPLQDRIRFSFFPEIRMSSDGRPDQSHLDQVYTRKKQDPLMQQVVQDPRIQRTRDYIQKKEAATTGAAFDKASADIVAQLEKIRKKKGLNSVFEVVDKMGQDDRLRKQVETAVLPIRKKFQAVEAEARHRTVVELQATVDKIYKEYEQNQQKGRSEIQAVHN